MNIIRLILTAIVVFAFVLFGIVKIAGVPEGLYKDAKEGIVDRYGFSRTGMRLIGISELIGALLVLMGVSWNYIQFAQVGNIILMVVTAGAMYFHNKFDSVTKDGLPAIIQFAINTILLILSFTVVH